MVLFFAKHRSCAAGELAGVQRDRDDLPLADTDFDATADEVRIQRVVVGVKPDVRIGRHPGHPAPVQVRLASGQRPHHLSLLEQTIDRPLAQRLVRPRVGLLKPRVELQLEVEMVREPPAGLEVRLQVALQPLDRTAHENIQRQQPRCLTIPGHTIDRAISQLLLDTVTPLALEVALTVQAELEARASEADQLRRSHVERARQHADLARRRYLAVDPDNRLVADTLEADWNDTLRALQAAQDEYDRQTAAANTALDEKRKSQIRQLATDFPKLWSDPATPARERKRIARLLIEDVTLNKSDQIHLHVRFRGGQTTSLTIPIPLNSWQARQTDPDTFAMLDRLLDDHTDAETAEQLNAAGRRTGTNKPFTAHIVSTCATPTISPATPTDSCSRPAHDRPDRPTTRRARQHDQGLAPRRTAHLPKSQRQERATLRPTRPQRPPTPTTHGLAPARPRTRPTIPTSAL